MAGFNPLFTNGRGIVARSNDNPTHFRPVYGLPNSEYSYSVGPMPGFLHRFLKDERGAVTVDWTALSSAAVAMALATVAVLNDGISTMVSRMDAELRDQQMSDNYIGFRPTHFEPAFALGFTTASYAEDLFETANSMMNQDILNAMAIGIEAIENGTLSQDDAVTLIALASVARQRNIIDAQVFDYYFGTADTAGAMYDLF